MPPPSAAAAQRPLYILYGSATGNAEQIAKDLARRYQEQYLRGAAATTPAAAIAVTPSNHPPFDAVHCAPLNDYKKLKCLNVWACPPPSLSQSNNVHQDHRYHGLLVILSTTGNGDAPENASRFVRQMKRTKKEVHVDPDHESSSSLLMLRHVTYAVLALGDTNYDNFCASGKQVDTLLRDLGACRFSHIACADEATGLEDVVEPWKDSIWTRLFQAVGMEKVEMGTADESPESILVKVNTIANDNREATLVSFASAPPFVEDSKPEMNRSSHVNGTTSGHVAALNNAGTMANTTMTATSSSSSSLAWGVATACSLLNWTERDLWSANESELVLAAGRNGEIGSVSATIQSLQPGSLPKPCSTCTFVDRNETGTEIATLDVDDGHHETTATTRRDMRALSIASSSSAGFHYTWQHPFPSRVLQARYLTQRTDYAAADQAASIWKAFQTQQQPTTTTGNGSLKDLSATDWQAMQASFELHFDLASQEMEDATTRITSSTAAHQDKRVLELTLRLPQGDDDNGEDDDHESDDFFEAYQYAPGDALGLVVPNDPVAVEEILQMLQKQGSNNTNGSGILQPQQLVSVDGQEPITVRELLQARVDLCSPIQKSKRIVQALSHYATDPLESATLRFLGGSMKTEAAERAYEQYIDAQRLTFVDLVREFPSVQPNLTLEALLTVLPGGIPPRYYSISSSPLQPHGKRQLTIAFAVVDYITPSLLVSGPGCVASIQRGLRRKHGVATHFMEMTASVRMDPSGLVSNNKAMRSTLSIFPKPTTEFRMPRQLSTPLILIGPGTGVAPFVGFLHHRRALEQQQQQQYDASQEAAQTVVEGSWRGAFEMESTDLHLDPIHDTSGLRLGEDYRRRQQQQQQLGTAYHNARSTIGSVDLLFGCRHFNHDWLYQTELQDFFNDGTLTRLWTAFSRDGPSESQHYKYVQDVLLKDSQCFSRVQDLILNQNASIYICGDGNAMARDVQAALVELLAHSLSSRKEAAQAYLQHMKEEKRLVLDIWS